MIRAGRGSRAFVSGTGGEEKTDRKADRRTRVTVLVALAANLVIAAAKAVGGFVAGSPALLSEAAHSVADSMNEIFLLAALRRSRRPAGCPCPGRRSGCPGVKKLRTEQPDVTY